MTPTTVVIPEVNNGHYSPAIMFADSAPSSTGASRDGPVSREDSAEGGGSSARGGSSIPQGGPVFSAHGLNAGWCVSGSNKPVKATVQW